MGLFGLASFTTEQKVKEIGIRKAMGASIANILPLIYKEFLILVLIAFLIAIPFSWQLMDNWLQNFAFHIALDWKIFLTSGLLAMTIAILTIGYHSLKAAKANPVESLRYE